MKNYNVIVVGAGHAGCEAARAAAKMGCKTLLITSSWDTVATFACNPSIGGPGRGQLVKELDALGGIMALAADENLIHSRRAGANKGPAARTPLTLVDKQAYNLYLKDLLEHQENLDIFQDTVVDIKRSRGKVEVITKLGSTFNSVSVILATGTFLNGKVLIGKKTFPGGRITAIPATEIVINLMARGLKFGRFSTGTSPRVDFDSINLAQLKEVKPEEPAVHFVNWRQFDDKPQLSYYVSRTNKKTHNIILGDVGCRRGLEAGNKMSEVGHPRHCPSLERKISSHPQKESHPVFIQPMSRSTKETYLQGLSMYYAPDIQAKIIRTIPGLEEAKIIRPGYAVAYDYLIPEQLKLSLETKAIPGLFTAGQINGTSGYEEAAAQGLIAGINAALKVQGKEEFILKRSEAFIGVLIDDLVTKGVDEPYRMFTSRAEYRLLLRSDNADIRLTPLGYKLGLLDDERLRRVVEKRGAKLGDDNLSEDVIEYLGAEALYGALITRTRHSLNNMSKYKDLPLPKNLDYNAIPGLSAAARVRLLKDRPRTLSEARGWAEVRAADLELLALIVKRKSVSRET